MISEHDNFVYYSAIEHVEAAKGKVYNVGGGMKNSLSLLELFALLEEFSDVKLDYTKLPPRESDQRVFVADIGRASQMMHWLPSVTAREGVARMVEWVSKEQ